MNKLWRKPFDAEAKTAKPAKILINDERCKGCSYCIEFCPREALVMSLEINSKGYTLAKVGDENKCLGCGLCEAMCPEFAIEVELDQKEN